MISPAQHEVLDEGVRVTHGSDTDGDLDLTSREAYLDLVGERKARGAYYTPPDVVEGLLRISLDPMLADRQLSGATAVAALRVLDPTCGTGNFLVPILERIMHSLRRCGVPKADASLAAMRCVVGVDLDEGAIEVCGRRLSAAAGVDGTELLQRQLRAADSLVMSHEAPLTLFTDADEWTWKRIQHDVGADEGFDLVIGNPPFLSQLQSDTSFSRKYAARLRDRFGAIAHGYTDSAALFLVVGVQLLKQHGARLCLIEPISVLGSQSASGVRSTLAQTSAMTDAWFAHEQVFPDAAVDVWAPVLVTGSPQTAVRLHVGKQMRDAGGAELSIGQGTSWSPLLAKIRGVPYERWATNGVLGDAAIATADFRDQYYGLVGCVVDSHDREELPRLVTSGLIDPAHLLWGIRSTRFNKESFDAPRVDVAALADDLRQWAEQRLVPKVLVATQARVLEAIVDESGVLLPSVPVLTVLSKGESLWKIAALLVSPPVCAIASYRHLGTALSSDALKLSAQDVLVLPLPQFDAYWTIAGALFEQASEADLVERTRLLRASGAAMCAAYGVADSSELMQWWEERMPKMRAERSDE
jgi:SAM-dependent methyltransferase